MDFFSTLSGILSDLPPAARDILATFGILALPFKVIHVVRLLLKALTFLLKNVREDLAGIRQDWSPLAAEITSWLPAISARNLATSTGNSDTHSENIDRATTPSVE